MLPNVAAPDTFIVLFKSTAFAISTSSLPFVVINFTYEFPPSLISKAAASLSFIVSEFACPSKSNVPPCVITRLPAGAIVKLPEDVDIVSLEPVTTMLPDFSWSILLLESTRIAELAVSVPAVWSSIATYKSPPIAVTAFPLAGEPMNSFCEFEEYANSPAFKELGAAVLLLLLILITCAISFSYRAIRKLLRLPCQNPLNRYLSL